MKSGTVIALIVAAVVVIASTVGAALIMVPGNNNTSNDSSSNVSTSDSGSCKVILNGNTGASLDGDGTYELGSKVTVKATCDGDTTFVAWLDADGNIVSESARYTFTPTSAGKVELFASCITEVTFSNGSTQLYKENGWKSATWTIYEHDGSTLTKVGTSTDGTYTFTEKGLYKVVIEAVDSAGDTVDMTSELKVGEMMFQYGWTYGSKAYSVEVEIPYSDYYLASNYSVSRSFDNSNYTNALSFVTPEEQCISSIAEQIEAQLQSYGVTDKEDIANIVLDLVQMSITYTEDSETYGQSEYWAFPVETLYYLKGDCEDTSFLFASIMKAMGYDTVLCYVQYSGLGGHAFAMIELDSCSGTDYSLSGPSGSYYCCETTPDNNYDQSNVGCSIVYYNYLSQSYCFLTDDTDSTPAAYNIVIEKQYTPVHPPSWRF